MKVIRSSFSLIFIFISVFAFSQNPRQITIEEIIDNPGRVIEEKIITEGIVTQFIPETSSTNAHYLLEGKYGGIIKVKTDEAEPIKNKNYTIIGTVYSENGRPFIHERSKNCLDCDGPITPPPPPEDNLLLYIIIGASVILIIVVIIFISQSKKNTTPIVQPATNIDLSGSKTSNDESSTSFSYSSDEDDFKTIKFSSADSDPKTMKFIPGKLEIISGEDKGKTFRIAGYPTPEGSIVTIGRKAIKGDRSFAHILIDRKFGTVSGLQAELVYRDGKLYVRNHSNTNPTQVDGIELSSNTLTELKRESVMRTGELEFKYTV